MGLKKFVKKAVKKVAKIAAGSLPGPLGAIAGAGVNALLGSKGSKKAASASAGGYEAAADEQRRALAQAGAFQQPFIDTASPAINSLMQLNSGDYSQFENSPDYLYARDEALSGVENSAAARGGLFSGNTGRRLAEVAGGLASQNLGMYRNSLMNQIGIGQSAANTMTGATLGTGQNIGATMVGAGDARASGIAGRTNALTGAVEDVAGVLGDYYGNRLIKRPVGAATTPPNKLTQRVPSRMVPY